MGVGPRCGVLNPLAATHIRAGEVQQHLRGLPGRVHAQAAQFGVEHVGGQVRTQAPAQLGRVRAHLLMRRICEQFSETCLRPRLVALHRDRVHAESLSEYALRLRVWRPYPR